MGTLNIDGMLSAKRTIFYTTDNSAGTTGNLTLRTNGDEALAPSLVFSIDGVKHSTIKMFSDGHFRFFNSSSSGYRNIYAKTFIGSLSGNAATSSIPLGFSYRETSWTWGTLTAANGYTLLTDWITPDTGGIAFADKGSQVSCQIDGYFYQNEGRYIVLDANNYTSYAPTKTGSGASGTWKINITGSAATASSASSASLLSIHNTVTNTSTRSVAASSWTGSVSGLKYVWGEAFKDTSLGSDTGDLVLGLRAGQYTSGGTELCMMIDGDYYSMGNKVLHAGNYNNYAPTKTGTGASGTWGINITGNANTANSAGVLSTTRSIFGQSFNGSGDVAGVGTFYGPYGDPRAIIIREASLSSTAHNSAAAAPTLNFWWEGKCQGSLQMQSNGNYYLTLEGNRAYLDANVPYATSANTANSATSATYSTYAGTTWTATCQGLKWRRICYVATDVGTVGTSGILNIRATRGNFVVNASFMICSSHSKQCQIVQLSSTYYSTVNIRGVVDSNGNFYIELYDDEVSIASGTNQTYYCSWLPLTRNSITVYTGATSGTTVPDGFAVSTGFRTAPGPYVVGNFVTHNFGSSLPSSAPYGAIFYKT